MTKSTILFPFLLFVYHFSYAQSMPVSWSFNAKKIADKTYEITLSADVQTPWHIYSQFTPEGGPVPTKITFNKNPLLIVEGEIKESGKKITRYEDVFGIQVIYFDGRVDFVQVIKLKSKAKTVFTGKVEFMVCNDHQCLPPAEAPFSIMLDNK